MKLLVFGTGEYYERFKKWITGEKVVALLDNSPAKQHTVIDGVEVLSPEEGVGRNHDAVVIMSFYIKAMKEQLIGLGVTEEKIYHFYDLRKLIRVEEKRQQIHCCGITEQELRENAGETTVLLSTDLALGGTALALFHLAKTLKKAGNTLVFASMIDGPLREQLEGCGIPVVIDSNLQLCTMKETEWVSGFRLIFCNAINFYIFLSERDRNVPVIWWLHDSAFFYDGVDREILRRISQENLTVLSVGPIPKRAIYRIRPELSVGQLLYGVEDAFNSGNGFKRKCDEQAGSQGKICFVTIGHIEERKGQDILLHAISLLGKEERQKAVFYLVGQDTSLLARQIRERAASMPEVVITGAVGREEIEKILNRADVMVCPSREDPMPTVAAEAMMHGVPCILSDATGTAAYITEGKDGLCFQSGEPGKLSEKLRWCMENRDRLGRMGKAARKIYEDKFSMNVFEQNVKHLVKGIL